MISGSKLGGFSGWKGGKLGEMLDPLVAQQIHGTNSTKSRQTNRSQKKLGYFCGEFSKLGRTQQKQARKQGVGLQIRYQPML